MCIHENSVIAHENIKPNKENIRKGIRHILFKCSEALTAEEILERTSCYLNMPNLTINSIAPRISEMLSEEPPRVKIVGFKEYRGNSGRKVKSRTVRPMTPSEQYQWKIDKKKQEAEENQPQGQLFSLLNCK